MTAVCFETLGNVCESITYGITAAADLNGNVGPKMLRITDITENGVCWDKVPRCCVTEIDEQVNSLRDGDLVVARTGGTVGKSFLISSPPRAVNASYLLRLRPDKRLIKPEYLSLFLNSGAYWSQLREAARGAAQPNVNATILSEISLQLPSLADQRRIAARLKAQLAEVDRARQAAQAQVRDVALLRNRLLQVVFDQPVREPTTLGCVLNEIQTGKSFLTAEVLARPDELGVLKVSAVSWSQFRADQAKALKGEYTPAENHRVKQGDLLISRANTRELVGAVVLVERDYPMRLLSDKTLRLVVDESRANKDYLLLALRTELARKHIELYATGTSDSMRNISQDVIASIPILLPPLDDQRHIVARLKSQLDEADTIIQAATAQLAEIDRLPQRLLAQTFNDVEVRS